MKSNMGGGGKTVGIAISESQLTAFIPNTGSSGKSQSWDLDPLSRVAGEWLALNTALSDLRSIVDKSYKTLTIAIMPPLVEMRVVELPKVQGADLRVLISRNAIRYFPSVREPQTVGANMIADSTPATYLAGTMSSRLLDVIIRTAVDTGWRVNTVLPAYSAWTAAAFDRWPKIKSTDEHVAVRVNAHCEVLQLDHGKLVGVRKFILDDVPPHQQAYQLDKPAESAARHVAAARELGPEILPESEYVRRAKAKRKVINWAVAAAAAALIVFAAGVLFDARRELHEIIAQRAELRASVSQVMSAQDDIAVLTGPIAALEKVETKAPIWSDVFVDFGSNLPRDAYIVNFRARVDSMSAEGFGARGASVFEAMGGAKIIDSVRAAGPIRRSAGRDSKPLDQFTLTGRVPEAAELFAPRGRNQR